MPGKTSNPPATPALAFEEPGAPRDLAVAAASGDDGETAVADERASEALLALLTDDGDEPARPIVLPDRIFGVVVGTLLELDLAGATVGWLGAPGGARARIAAALGAEHVGRDVAVVFEQGDPSRPIVLGVMERFEPVAEPPAAVEPVADASPPADGPRRGEPGVRVEALADGERVVLEADRELVLSCGKASITLTRAGKVLIRGAYVSSHATGTQRIRGGTVEIN